MICLAHYKKLTLLDYVKTFLEKTFFITACKFAISLPKPDKAGISARKGFVNKIEFDLRKRI
ncbi:MAG: hypothetical protein A2905_01920 [Candidatus Levybacteria bacterium RIFCSPLOWO2_01_FULL_36_10]|nr:MAG: hypothetical protein A2905_01920 [Candidatus Levybacteria bacterium RIFCSPLOWO2_01_FULL_36_10]